MFYEEKTSRILFATSLIAILYMWSQDKGFDQKMVRSLDSELSCKVGDIFRCDSSSLCDRPGLYVGPERVLNVNISAR